MNVSLTLESLFLIKHFRRFSRNSRRKHFHDGTYRVLASLTTPWPVHSSQKVAAAVRRNRRLSSIKHANKIFLPQIITRTIINNSPPALRNGQWAPYRKQPGISTFTRPLSFHYCPPDVEAYRKVSSHDRLVELVTFTSCLLFLDLLYINYMLAGRIVGNCYSDGHSP